MHRFHLAALFYEGVVKKEKDFQKIRIFEKKSGFYEKSEFADFLLSSSDSTLFGVSDWDNT